MKYETLAWKISEFGLFGSTVELILRVWMMVVVKKYWKLWFIMGANGFGVWF